MKFMRFTQYGTPNNREITINMAHVLAVVPNEDGGSTLMMAPFGDGHALDWHVTETLDQIGARSEWNQRAV